jgi:hypothetical protein
MDRRVFFRSKKSYANQCMDFSLLKSKKKTILMRENIWVVIYIK